MAQHRMSSIKNEIRKGPMTRCAISGLYFHRSQMVHDNLGRWVSKKAFRLTRLFPTQLQMKGGVQVIDTQEGGVFTTQQEGEEGSQQWTWQ